MSSYWVNFATTGDPNGHNLPAWTAFGAKKNPDLMVLGDKVEMGAGPDPGHLKFFQDYYEKRESAQ